MIGVRGLQGPAKAEWGGGWWADSENENRKKENETGGLLGANGPIWFGPQKKIEDCFLNFDSRKRGFK
jgi:hypothetical protein